MIHVHKYVAYADFLFLLIFPKQEIKPSTTNDIQDILIFIVLQNKQELLDHYVLSNS